MIRIIVLAFGAIQLILAARLAIDFGFLPSTGAIADFVTPASEALAAPIQALTDALGIDLGGAAGTGFNPAILAALVGWSAIEGLALMIFSRSAGR